MEDSDTFDKDQLESKKRAFLEAVKQASKDFDFTYIPYVEFHEGRCPNDNGQELAHIHIDTATICVSLPRLKMMSIDQVRDVARHEVTHMVDPGHDSGFNEAKTTVDIASTQAESGVMVIDGGEPATTFEKSHPSPEDKEKCNYHLCRKATELTQCQHCKRYFCEKHIKPKIPSMPNFDANTFEERQLLEEWRSEDAHPCPDYYDVFIMELQRRKDEYSNALNKLLRYDNNSAQTPRDKTRPCMGCGKEISERYDYCDDCYKSYKERMSKGSRRSNVKGGLLQYIKRILRR